MLVTIAGHHILLFGGKICYELTVIVTCKSFISLFFSKAGVSAATADRSLTYSPVLSQSPRPPESATDSADDTLIDNKSDITSTSTAGGVPLSGASEER